jgi:hypothetical protein
MPSCLVESIRKVFTAKSLPDTPSNRLNYIAPLFLDASQGPLLRDAAFEVCIHSLVSLSLAEEVEQSLPVISDILESLKGDCRLLDMHSDRIEQAFVHVVELLQSAASAHQLQLTLLEFILLSFRTTVDGTLQFLNRNPLMRSLFFELVNRKFHECTRKRSEAAFHFLQVLKCLSVGDTAVDLIDGIRHLLSLGNNALYTLTLELMAVIRHGSYDALFRESRPLISLQNLSTAWLIEYGTFLRHHSFDRRSFFEFASQYVSDYEPNQEISGALSCLASPAVESNLFVCRAIQEMIASSKTQSKLYCAIQFARGYFTNLRFFSDDDARLLRHLARMRDESPSELELVKDIESVFGFCPDAEKILAIVPLFESASQLFRGWLVSVIKGNLGSDASYFMSHFVTIVDKFHPSDPVVPQVVKAIFSLFPTCLKNTSVDNLPQLQTTVVPKLLELCKSHPIITCNVLSAFKDWFASNFHVKDQFSSITESVCSLCFEHFCSNPSANEYILASLPTFLSCSQNSLKLLSSLEQHISRSLMCLSGIELIRLLEAFAPLQPDRIFRFCFSSLSLECDPQKKRALYKVTCHCAQATPLIIDRSFISSCPFIKEKLRLLYFTGGDDEHVIKAFLPDVVFSLKDTSSKTRHLAESLLAAWSRTMDTQRFVELLAIGFVSDSSTMRGATVLAVDIVLTANPLISQHTFDAVLACILALPVSNEVMRALLKLACDQLHHNPQLVDPHFETIVSYPFSHQNAAYAKHNMDLIRKVLTTTASLKGWACITDALPQKHKKLSRNLRKKTDIKH